MVRTKGAGSGAQSGAGSSISGIGHEAEQLRLDPANACVWRGTEAVSLTRKAFAVLRHLVEHPRRLVTKKELLEAVWPSTYVGDAVLKVSVLEIRKALRDSHLAPRFIETVHRSGYRFLGGIVTATAPEPALAFDFGAHAAASPARVTVPLVGRAAALDGLDALLESAASGERQVALLSGEVGIGKSTVVDAFLARLQGADAPWVLRGQCRQQSGPGEDYLPVLEALSRLCRETGRERLVDLLRRRAPTWLAQMPWLIASGDRETLQRELHGLAKERMLREMAETIEALSAVVPLVVVLEDLHWSDLMTLDLVAALARRRHPARLLVVGTYRTTDVATGDDSIQTLSQDLWLHRLGAELPLPLLSERDVAEYLRLRFDGETSPAELATIVHRRSDGNPLFVTSLVDDLVASGGIERRDGGLVLQADADTVAVAVPDCLRALIEKRVERLPAEDRELLAAASVAGVEFAGIALAAALDADPVAMEERCELLARRGEFLAATGVAELADGSLAGRYRFRHALYRDVLFERLSPGRRLRLQQRTEHAQRAAPREGDALAGELGASFGRGRDRVRSGHARRRGVTTNVKPIARLSAL